MSIGEPMSATELRPRAIYPVPAVHAVYLRPGRNDHTALLELLAERVPPALAGVVLDPHSRSPTPRTPCRARVQESGTRARHPSNGVGDAQRLPRICHTASVGWHCAAPPWRSGGFARYQVYKPVDRLRGAPALHGHPRPGPSTQSHHRSWDGCGSETRA